MTARCKKCNHCEYFDKNDEFGYRLKLKDQMCECGGLFIRVYPTSEENIYEERNGRKWELTAIGEFRNPQPILTLKKIPPLL